jgi:flagellar basal-body rod modification protein FlgD
MNVQMNTTQPSTANSTEQSSKTAVDYQSFLKLLVAEMKNQDPTNPMDSTQYVAQLAAFSQVEQSVQINTKLDQLLQSSSLAQADALIGRTVTSADGKVTGKVAEVRLLSDGIVAVLEGGKEITMGPGVKIAPSAS